MKILIVANVKWINWPQRLGRLRAWFLPKIAIEFNLQETNYKEIPFAVYPDVIGLPKGVDPIWYDIYISSQARGYEAIVFLVASKDWRGSPANWGFRTDKSLGPWEVQICCDENERIYYPNNAGEEDAFFEKARHEILHVLYAITGQEDNTHKWLKEGLPIKALEELVFTTPKQIDTVSLIKRVIELALQAIGLLKKQIERILPPVGENNPPGENKPKEDKILAFCKAIQVFEGYFKPGENPKYPNGSGSYQRNNPGNFRYVPGMKYAIGQKNGFAVFPSYDIGFQFLKEFITKAATEGTKYYKPTMNILQFCHIYAPAADFNDPIRYARFLSSKVGLNITSQLKELL